MTPSSTNSLFGIVDGDKMTCRSFGLLCLCLCWTVVFGQQQNYVNVARGKTYSQISKYKNTDLSSKGANGNTTGDYSGILGTTSNCIHTKEYRTPGNEMYSDNNPWWQVDLGRTYPLHRIDIWARTGYERRVDPANITVDNQRCTSTRDFQWNSREKEVTCSSVMYGRKVRITRQGNDEPLNMCEMQIWVPSEVSDCQVGRYGPTCTSTCSDNCGKGPGKNFCYKNNGYCYDGCVDGWYGDQCSTHCSPGCQNTVCDRQSGQCSCTTGYTGNKCTECQNGYYKTVNGTCERCSSNCLAQTCDSQTGRCNGCVAGRYGVMCNNSPCQIANCHRCDQDTGQVCSQCTPNSFLLLPGCTDCPDGYFKRPDNTGCTLCTPNCKSGTICDKNTGHCPICPPGKQGNFCDQDCNPGSYGQNCTEKCGQCQSQNSPGYCRPDTGQCVQGCLDGWQGLLCKTECDNGQYGPGCTGRCGQCKGAAACNKTNGHCAVCDPGWNFPLCNTVCLDGWYGENCAKRCGSCEGGVPCNKSSGHCRCPIGKQPPFCATDCQGQKYGQDCTASCGQCRGGKTCDPVTGRCSEGCQPGWTDPPSSLHNFCQSECKAGRYGLNCTQQCGHCLDTHLYGQCHPETGLCPYTCQEGWKMPLCKQEGSSESVKEAVNTNALIGSVLGGAFIIGISVIILGILLKRRFVKSTETRQNNNTFNDFNMSSTPSGPEARGERGQKSAVSQGPQNQEQPYEIHEDTAVATVDVHPGVFTTSDIKYPQSEADSDNPYDELTVQYSNTGNVHVYGH